MRDLPLEMWDTIAYWASQDKRHGHHTLIDLGLTKRTLRQITYKHLFTHIDLRPRVTMSERAYVPTINILALRALETVLKSTQYLRQVQSIRVWSGGCRSWVGKEDVAIERFIDSLHLFRGLRSLKLDSVTLKGKDLYKLTSALIDGTLQLETFGWDNSVSKSLEGVVVPLRYGDVKPTLRKVSFNNNGQHRTLSILLPIFPSTITSLSIHNFVPLDGGEHMINVLFTLTFPKVQTFKTTVEELTDDLCHFLMKNSTITTLKLPRLVGTPTLVEDASDFAASKALPNLHTLKAHFPVTELLIPKRPVVNAVFYNYIGGHEAVCYILSCSKANRIEQISFSLSKTKTMHRVVESKNRRIGLKYILVYYPRLKVLQMPTSNDRGLKILLPQIAQFRHLRKLQLDVLSDLRPISADKQLIEILLEPLSWFCRRLETFIWWGSIKVEFRRTVDGWRTVWQEPVKDGWEEVAPFEEVYYARKGKECSKLKKAFSWSELWDSVMPDAPGTGLPSFIL